MFKIMINIALSALLYQYCILLTYVPATYKINNISDDIIALVNIFILNFEYLFFPLPTIIIKYFEMKNPDISVNVFR